MAVVGSIYAAEPKDMIAAMQTLAKDPDEKVARGGKILLMPDG